MLISCNDRGYWRWTIEIAQEISSLSITARAREHTLWTWERCNCRRISQWSLLGTSGVKSGALDCRWLRRDIVFGAKGYCRMPWDSGALKVEESLVWRLALVQSGVTPGGCGVAKASGWTRSRGRLNERLSVIWTRVDILMSQFLTTTNAPHSFTCQSLRKGSQKSGIGRHP